MSEGDDRDRAGRSIDRRRLILGGVAAACAPLLELTDLLGRGRADHRSLPGISGRPSSGTRRERADASPPLFRISLAEWSFHRALQAGEIDHLELASVARREFGIDAVEYINTFFADRVREAAYLREMARRADGEGVRSLLIMCDRLGRVGDPDPEARTRAVESHREWIRAARYLGCHSIRVNAASEGSREEQRRLVADGLHRLAEHADDHDLDVLVENHGRLSSDGGWLAATIEAADHPRVGTLPDFGNFRIDEETTYDNYRGVRELMPWARAVSAKSYAFDEAGDEVEIDYRRMMRIVLDAGYRGYVGIEYEGTGLSERDGVRATQRLLERVRRELAPEYE